MTPKETRLAAVKAFHAAVCPEPAHKIVMTREEIVEAIGLHLVGLSRAPRWNDAVDAYAALVADPDNPFDWAYFQGSVWFGFAVDGLL